MNEQIKQTTKDILKADYITLLIASALFSAISRFAGYINTNFSASIVSGVITTAATACFACFYLNAFKRGKGQLNDIFSMFTDKANLPKFLVILVIMCLVDIGIAKLTLMLDIIPVIGISISLVLVFFVTFMLRIVWFLFAVNPQYPVRYYFKGSAEYMSSNIISALAFSFTVTFMPLFLISLTGTFAGDLAETIVSIPLKAYVNLAFAGFYAHIIPDEWDNGTVEF